MAKYHKVLHFNRYSKASTNPILTENGVIGKDKFAVWSNNEYNSNYSAYKSFTTGDTTYCAISQNGYGKSVDKPYHYIIYFPYKGAKLTKITHKNRGTYVASPKYIALQASNDCSKWITLTKVTNSNNTANAVWDLNIPLARQGYYKYYRYIITSSNSENYCALGFLTLVGDWYTADYSEVPIYTNKFDDDIVNRALPIVIDNKVMYVGYGDSTYNGTLKLSNINCKYEDITPNGAKLLKM